MTSPLAGLRILVVDDERGIAAQVVRQLERAGASCVAAHSGREGLDRLVEGAFDLVVTDTQMPGASGFDLLDAAQRLATSPAVIVMTAPGASTEPTTALERGADGYVVKPFVPEMLEREAGVAVELRALRAQSAAAGTVGAAGPVLLVLGEVVSAAERADPFRTGYSSRTARLAGALAGPLGLDAERLTIAARVHDVGMLAVPVVELAREGTLARQAQHLVRVHPTLGARWIERLGADRAIIAAVAAHQERYDGDGYPGGLAGADIPPLARALGTAAAIAAMCAARPWRRRRDPADLLHELQQGRDTQFGGAEVDAALEVLRSRPDLLG
jgi:response regulator RpfG family c-di-GMP phosphodiesterase